MNNELINIDAAGYAIAKREETEIQSAIISARKFPRDEEAAIEKFHTAMQRKSLADKSMYSFPRGGANVSGPSIGMAREAARCWGNIRHGIRIVSVDGDQVHIKGYALDLETNTYIECEDKFQKLIYRAKKWTVPDERDLRELINRRGAILVRNAILQLIPTDVIDDALKIAKQAIVGKAKSDLKKDKTANLTALCGAFAELNVTINDIEKYIGCNIGDITPEHVAELRIIYTTIKDGNAKVSEYFKPSKNESQDLNSLLENVRE